LLDQWVELTKLRLDKAAHQIAMRMDEKLELIKLIAKSEETPDNSILQTFLIQQLLSKDGVKFVDLEPIEGAQEGNGAILYVAPNVEGLYTMELCGDFGFCAPTLDPHALDRSLNIVRVLSGDSGPNKRLVVRVDFDSFLNPLNQMSLLEGSTALLTTSTGQLLAATDKGMSGRRRLGETGDYVELQTLQEMRQKPFGTVFGKGHPPDTVVSFYKMPMINWYLLVFSKGEVILEPIVKFRSVYIAAGGAILVGILLLIQVATQSTAKRIAEISAAAVKVCDGDYNVQLEGTAQDEIGALRQGFNEMIQGLRQRDIIENTFGRYVDREVAKELMSRPEALLLGGEKRIVTIMMSDLRNFTAASEKLSPERVIKMLNRYFGRMIAVIEERRGIIVDFFGDSILVFFDGIQSDPAVRAEDAIRCALTMQQEHQEFLKENEARDLPYVPMGIGIHTGEVIVGNIGAETRAKYGIVGSSVNFTDRIQATASAGKVVISEDTYELIKDRLSISLTFNACLKGVEEDRTLYEVASVNVAPR
jgi:class 3 adenylate cyclase